MRECLFCRIVNKEVPAPFLFESSEVVAFADRSPQAPVHVLIVPKKHVACAVDLSTEDAGLLAHVYQAARALADHFSVRDAGFRLVVNQGPDAGQTVGHLHHHFLAGRRLGWPPG